MIDFGDWINKHKENFSDDVYGLFYDSLRCFKNDIDRPSYLLAYQGMVAYIRNLILVSPCPPTGITDIDWKTNYLRDINCDDKCDEKLKICIQQGTKGSGTKVLSMPKEAREKFDFWRQLRNVSAHYKGFDLVKAHTTALYAFIEQYLLNIHIEGSKGSLEQEFDDYFNPALTSPSEDVMPHIQKIDEMVEPSELATFFDTVRKSIHHHHPYHSRFTEFVHTVINNSPARVKEKACEYVNADGDLQTSCLEKYPKDVLLLLYGCTNVRNFWYSKMPYLRSRIHLLAYLLCADMIPDCDINEAILKCLDSANSTSSDYSCFDESLSQCLQKYGYFDEFYKKYFNAEYSRNNYQKINYNMDFYMGHIAIMPKDKKFVETISEIVDENFKPFALENALRNMYRNDSNYKNCIDDICCKENITISSNIV